MAGDEVLEVGGVLVVFHCVADSADEGVFGVGGEEVLDEGSAERAVCARNDHRSSHRTDELDTYRGVLELLEARGRCLVRRWGFILEPLTLYRGPLCRLWYLRKPIVCRGLNKRDWNVTLGLMGRAADAQPGSVYVLKQA